MAGGISGYSGNGPSFQPQNICDQKMVIPLEFLIETGFCGSHWIKVQRACELSRLDRDLVTLVLEVGKRGDGLVERERWTVDGTSSMGVINFSGNGKKTWPFSTRSQVSLSKESVSLFTYLILSCIISLFLAMVTNSNGLIILTCVSYFCSQVDQLTNQRSSIIEHESTQVWRRFHLGVAAQAIQSELVSDESGISRSRAEKEANT